MLDANAHVGPDVINFSVAGTIQLTSGTLPAISTGAVDIAGNTAPGFAGAPLVEVDFNHFAGLRFSPGATGSTLQSLALDNAGGAGVTVNGGGGIFVFGNYIGLGLNGNAVAGNAGDGVQLNVSFGNVIGGAGESNVISGNSGNGININGSSGNHIEANLIGTDATGMLDRGNSGNGVLVTAGAATNDIGSTTGNVISGNDANGVLINAQSTQNIVSGNFIGLAASGTATVGNTLDGVSVQDADNNLIGQVTPGLGVNYYSTAAVATQPVSAWQGIRNADSSGQYLITGTSNSAGLLFDGTIAGVGTSYAVNFPNAANTSVYGPDNLGGGAVGLVGSYQASDASTAAVTVNGFIFQGTTAQLTQAGNYRTIDYPGAKFNYVHSTMGGLAVGNYDSPLAHGTFSLPLGPGHAFIYNVALGTFVADVAFPGSLSNSAYGIWANGGTSYTIVGGYSLDPVNNFTNQNQPIGHAYMVDYDSATGLFTHWASFDYPNGTGFVTHFEGISSVQPGVYTLSADSVQAGSTNPAQGSFVTVTRNADGSFGPATWVNLNYPGVNPTTNVTSSNSVYGNQVVGLVVGPQGGISFQASVNATFQLSNVISGNGGNGVGLYAANDSQVAMNYIGTDVTGTLDRGNAGNGILVALGSTGNTIGGDVTGGNDPTNDIFAIPPQGNLISGNDADGVLITGAATQNILSGNFIGTTASGNSKLGNSHDGVAIVNANGNSLLGCTFVDSPFVFYNVISGNGANGLQVTNSNDTTIQANFFGMSANNAIALGNVLNGVVVDGSSTDTVMGGPIPLGNVDSANGQNGIVVSDTASFFTTYNTFCGLAAFSITPTFGNGADGMLITSTGGNILIRTCVITENGNDGIEISGAAQGVRIAGNQIGLSTQGNMPMGNVKNGVEVDGDAHDIIIGGPQPTFNVVPHNAISANGANGVAIDGSAYNVTVSFDFIGTDLAGGAAEPNGMAGVFVGPGTYSNTIGSTDPSLFNVISGNLGAGIEMNGTFGNTVIGSLIGVDLTGALPLPNGGDGVLLTNSFNNFIGHAVAGGKGPANVIAFNDGSGVNVASGTGNAILDNSIYANGLLGIDLGKGGNMGQAAPVLTAIQMSPFGMQVSGTLSGKPSTVYTVEFFASDTSGASGRVFLGFQAVKTNPAGIAMFTFFGQAPPAGDSFITATATDKANNTSEFSAALITVPTSLSSFPPGGFIIDTTPPADLIANGPVVIGAALPRRV
jgi:hypothetical protein